MEQGSDYQLLWTWIAGKGRIAELEGFGGKTSKNSKNSRKNGEGSEIQLSFFIDESFPVPSSSTYTCLTWANSLWAQPNTKKSTQAHR